MTIARNGKGRPAAALFPQQILRDRLQCARQPRGRATQPAKPILEIEVLRHSARINLPTRVMRPILERTGAKGMPAPDRRGWLCQLDHVADVAAALTAMGYDVVFIDTAAEAS